MVKILRERLRMYLAAERAILSGQSYTIGDRQLQRPDLKYVQNMIADLTAQLTASKSGRVKRIVPME